MQMQHTEVPQVLGIVGSPRRGGNTETLVDEVLAGAAEAGAHVAKVILAECDIRPCRACDQCAELGRCSQEDAMAALLAQMEASAVWVLGTPVYWWGPTAQFKAFIDRWYGAGRAVQFRGRAVILVVPLGDGVERTARHTVGMMEDSLRYVKAQLVAKIVAPGLMHVGDAQGQPALLSAARRAGREAVALRASSVGKKRGDK